MNYAKLKKIKKLYFGYEEIARILQISPASARVTVNRYAKNGFLVRIKRNLYVLKDIWEGLDKEEKFILANLAQVPSYISLMTAMDYYEITTQIQRDFIESIALKRTKGLKIDGTIFNYSKMDKNLFFGFSKQKGFFIASPEKAFLDILYLTSLKRYNFDPASIDINKLNMPKVKTVIKKFPVRTQKLLKNYGYIEKA